MRSDKMGPFIDFTHPDRKQRLILVTRNKFPCDFSADSVVLFKTQQGILIEPQFKAVKCVVMEQLFSVDALHIFENGGEQKTRLRLFLNQVEKGAIDLFAPFAVRQLEKRPLLKHPKDC